MPIVLHSDQVLPHMTLGHQATILIIKFMKVYFEIKNTKLTSKHEACAGNIVPPPIVPNSMDGIVHEIYKSLLSGPHGSIIVMQFELPTFWAGS